MTKETVASKLETIEGVGVMKRRQLLQTFGGMQGLKDAGVSQIEKVAGYTNKELKKYPKNGIIWFRKEKNNLYFPIKIEISSSWGKFVCLIKERKLNSESNNM